MIDDSEPTQKGPSDITLGCELYAFSVSDIEERITLLKEEILRLEAEKKKKLSSLEDAGSFFKI